MSETFQNSRQMTCVGTDVCLQQALHLSTDGVTPSQRATGLVRQDLCLVKLCWVSHIPSLFSMYLSTASRRVCSMIFPSMEVRSFPGSSFPLLLKIGTIFPFSTNLTSLDCHEFSNIVEAGLQTTLPIPPGPWDAYH